VGKTRRLDAVVRVSSLLLLELLVAEQAMERRMWEARLRSEGSRVGCGEGGHVCCFCFLF
jgi:hypothetical protein